MAPAIEDRFDEVPETYYLEEEGDFEFVVVSAEQGPTKNGERERIEVALKPITEDGTDYAPVRQWITLPNEDDWDTMNDFGKPKAHGFMRGLRRFLFAFGLPRDFEDASVEFPGAKGKGRVRFEVDKDDPEKKYARINWPAVPKNS